MTNNTLLLELCKPYLLDLLTALIESLKHPNEPMYELLEGVDTKIHIETFTKIDSLTEQQISELLIEIGSLLRANNQESQPTTNNQ